jgi:hypothetical protein
MDAVNNNKRRERQRRYRQNHIEDVRRHDRERKRTAKESVMESVMESVTESVTESVMESVTENSTSLEYYKAELLPIIQRRWREQFNATMETTSMCLTPPAEEIQSKDPLQYVDLVCMC